jgi:hypothetical protein
VKQFRHCVSGEPGTVEIESQWTARRRERMGVFLIVQTRPPKDIPPKQSLDGAPSRVR